MALDPDFKEFLLELMAPLGPVEIRRFFGGGGAFADGLMFALIAGGETLHFRVDDGNRAMFEAEGMKPFSYERKTGRREVNSYWQAPERLYDEPEEFVVWAREALSAAMRMEAAKPQKKRKAAARKKTAPKKKAAPKRKAKS